MNEKLLRTLKIPIEYRRNRYHKKLSKRLNVRDFTLITNNCIAGVILHDLGLQFDTPTINLFFNLNDFIKYVSNLEKYSTCELVEYRNTNVNYPVGILKNGKDSIKINFMHYNSFEEARDSWVKRTKRIHFDNIYVIMESGDNTSKEIREGFNDIPYKNKVLLSDKDYPEVSKSIGLKIYDDDYYPGKILAYRMKKLSVKRYISEFDFMHFLNTGDVKRK